MQLHHWKQISPKFPISIPILRIDFDPTDKVNGSKSGIWSQVWSKIHTIQPQVETRPKLGPIHSHRPNISGENFGVIGNSLSVFIQSDEKQCFGRRCPLVNATPLALPCFDRFLILASVHIYFVFFKGFEIVSKTLTRESEVSNDEVNYFSFREERKRFLLFALLMQVMFENTQDLTFLTENYIVHQPWFLMRSRSATAFYDANINTLFAAGDDIYGEP